MISKTKLNSYFFILGAKDNELITIEDTLKEVNAQYGYAAIDGEKIQKASSAYEGNGVVDPIHLEPIELGTLNMLNCVFVETHVKGIEDFIKVDHHYPGDPGFNKPAKQYWEASSLGQVYALLEIEAKGTHYVDAAIDHALASAYLGHCPNVSISDVILRRQESQLKRYSSLAHYRHNLQRGMQQFCKLPMVELNDSISVKDGRGKLKIPIADVACRLGQAILATRCDRADDQEEPTEITRYIILSASREEVKAFIGWVEGNEDVQSFYGDPERGMLGAFITPKPLV